MARDGDGIAILKKAASAMPMGSPWRERIREALGEGNRIGLHLGVFVEPFLEAILDGRKTIESRFGVHRCAPFDRVRAGDIILLKRSGGPIVGIALAGGTAYYELDPETLENIRERFATQILAEDDDFWVSRADKRFATLIEIDEVTKIDTLSIDKRDRRGWVTYMEGRQPCLALAG
jgi:ASC-1-like (ASCH) protein